MDKTSQHVWRTKYRYAENGVVHDRNIEDTWRRVAKAIAAVEPRDREIWEARFFDILEGFKFLPGGRILAGAGTDRRVTLFNCFVMGVIEDSLPGILRALSEGAVTLQQGGGIGYDFSTLRPRGMRAKGVGAIASGPVSFMTIWDPLSDTLMSTVPRRAAIMGSLRCDHPDIETFVAAKREPGRLRHFNLSVQITDAFMKAVREDTEWPPGAEPRRLRARELWDTILRTAYETAEPGVLFVDRINRLNNLWYRETITTKNPRGEVPLPPYGACDLGSINLTRFIENPFTAAARLDTASLDTTVETAVRFLDNVISTSRSARCGLAWRELARAPGDDRPRVVATATQPIAR